MANDVPGISVNLQGRSVELTRTELRRIAEEFQSERDAAKSDAMRAFDERNIALNQLKAAQERIAVVEAALRELVECRFMDAHFYTLPDGEYPTNVERIALVDRQMKAWTAARAALATDKGKA